MFYFITIFLNRVRFCKFYNYSFWTTSFLKQSQITATNSTTKIPICITFRKVCDRNPYKYDKWIDPIDWFQYIKISIHHLDYREDFHILKTSNRLANDVSTSPSFSEVFVHDINSIKIPFLTLFFVFDNFLTHSPWSGPAFSLVS